MKLSPCTPLMYCRTRKVVPPPTDHCSQRQWWRSSCDPKWHDSLIVLQPVPWAWGTCSPARMYALVPQDVGHLRPPVAPYETGCKDTRSLIPSMPCATTRVNVYERIRKVDISWSSECVCKHSSKNPLKFNAVSFPLKLEPFPCLFHYLNSFHTFISIPPSCVKTVNRVTFSAIILKPELSPVCVCENYYGVRWRNILLLFMVVACGL